MMFVRSKVQELLTRNVRLLSQISSESSSPITSPLLRQLDSNVSPASSLPKLGKSKLRRNLEKPAASVLSNSQLGALESIEEDVYEIIEDCLKSNELLGIFPGITETSKVFHIKHVKVNRDVSHIDVTWGSDVLEGFVGKIFQAQGKIEGKRMREKIFGNATKAFQNKEAKFRTYLMRISELRRVPRIFFRAPSPEDEDGDSSNQAINPSEMDEWRKEEKIRMKKLEEWEKTAQSPSMDFNPIIPLKRPSKKRKNSIKEKNDISKDSDSKFGSSDPSEVQNSSP